MSTTIYKVCINAGHGGDDPGSVGIDGRYEKDDTLRYARVIKDALEAKHVECVMLRNGDTNQDKANREQIARECAISIDCHRDSAGETASGASVYLWTECSSSTLEWAERMVSAIENAGMPLRSTPIQKGATFYKDFWINQEGTQPSMLIELGFVTNPADNAAFDQNLTAIGEAIANVIFEKILELPAWENSNINPPTGGDGNGPEFGEIIGTGEIYFRLPHANRPEYSFTSKGGAATIELLQDASGNYIGCKVSGASSVVTLLEFHFAPTEKETQEGGNQ